MIYKTFEALPSNKKEVILKVCIEEFAEYGYENASTNRIVKKINMSKGSLFKYFNTKEELYFYVVDHVANNLTSEVVEDMRELPSNIFERLYMLAASEFDFYINKPIFYKLFKRAFDGKSEISKKLIEKYTVQAGSFFDHIFQGAEFENEKYDKEHMLNLIKWVLQGYNEHFMEANANKMWDVNKLKKKYLDNIQMYITMIRLGIGK